MADDKETIKDSKVIDVAKPGKSAPSASSKPIIVTNHPLLPDPMIVEDKPTESTDEPKDSASVPPSVSRLKIEPISKPEDIKPSKDEKADEVAKEDETTEDSADGVDSRDKLKDPTADEQDIIASKAAERQANLDKIALAKTYYLPINQVVRRRSKHVAIAGVVLIIILGVAWADVAIDAGLVTVPGVKAPTHLFSK